MEKKRALKKRALALCSALFLIFVLAVPAFASSGSGDIVINGILIFATDMDLSEYFTLSEDYSVSSGSFAVYDETGLLATGYTHLSVQDGYVNYSLVATGDTDRVVAATSSDSFTDVYNSYNNRYLVFDDVVVSSSSPIYLLCKNCSAVTSTLTFYYADVIGNNIVDVVVGGFNGILTGFGSGTADFFETIFLNNDGSLTTFAIVGLVALGVGFAVGIARWVVKKVGQ